MTDVYKYSYMRIITSLQWTYIVCEYIKARTPDGKINDIIIIDIPCIEMFECNLNTDRRRSIIGLNITNRHYLLLICLNWYFILQKKK